MPYAKPYDEKLIRLTKQGASITETAAILNLSTRSVSRRRAALGISTGQGGQPVHETVLAQARLMAEDGASCREIARTVGVAPKTVAKYFPHAVWGKEQIADLNSALQTARHALRKANREN